MTHFNILGPVTSPRMLARWYNTLQTMALTKTRLGIPITISSDPRHHFTENIGTSFRAGSFSQWPETLGFAALRSKELVQRFAEVAREEYLAVGIRVALHPQIDLATEPRWARINATFGEDAELSSELGAAYIRGFQGEKQPGRWVATMTKHFPGGGPQKDGEDPHFTYGKEQVYPGKNFEYHLRPFKAALKAGTSQMMPYYGMPVGTEYEEVGFAFHKGIISGLLREQLGFTGIVCTDWGLITDATLLGQDMPARAWGAERLSELERVHKILDAGCDQFGGESRPDLVIKLVEDGLVPESRLDESVRRLLTEKFSLGLFDHPFISEDAAETTVGGESFKAEGESAQRRSYTLLTNHHSLLPLDPETSKSQKFYVEGFSDPSLLTARRGMTTVSSPTEADIALLRLRTPYDPRPGGFEAHFHAGTLEFSAAEKSRQSAIYAAIPTVVDLYLDRPAVVPEIFEGAAALLCSYGSSADAFLDVVFGQVRPGGKLPFDLPRSMEDVRRSREDVPFDTERPVARFGDGLTY